MVTPDYIRTIKAGKMNQQEHAGAYCAAIEAAMDELDLIRQKFEGLRSRQYQFETVLEVLKPLIGSDEQTAVEDRHPVPYLIETATEPARTDESTLPPVEIALSQFVPQNMRESADSLQRRIDSILGVAVS